LKNRASPVSFGNAMQTKDWACALTDAYWQLY